MKPILKFSLLFFLQALPGIAHSHPAQWTLDLPDSELPSDLHSGFPKEAPGVSWDSYFKSHPSLRNLNLGIQMKGTNPLSRKSSTPMLPASVQKVLTAAAALKYLGPEARFENFFIADQDVVQGFVKNVRFKVSGDPTWANESFEGVMDESTENLNLRLQKVIDALKARFVKQVRGPITVESLRPGLAELSRPEGWRESWNLECMAVMQTEFQANGNCGDFQITSLSRYGWTTSGVSVPVVMKIQKSREGVNSVQPHPVFDSRGRIIQYVFSGHLAKGPIHFELPVHQSGEWLKNLFVRMLKESGIEYLPNVPEAFFPLAATPIEVDLSSRPLIEILRQAVQYSINGVMDRIFLEVGFQRGGASAPIAASDAVLEMMREKFNDESLMSGLVVQDGSGLNLLDRMRPDSLYRFLDLIRSESYFSDLFSTLAIAGKAGTLLNRPTLVASSYTYSKIFAKTGTLNGVTNLAGYFWPSETATPEPFVVFTDSDVSPVAARPMVDGIVVNFAAQNSRKN